MASFFKLDHDLDLALVCSRRFRLFRGSLEQDSSWSWQVLEASETDLVVEEELLRIFFLKI